MLNNFGRDSEHNWRDAKYHWREAEDVLKGCWNLFGETLHVAYFWGDVKYLLQAGVCKR